MNARTIFYLLLSVLWWPATAQNIVYAGLKELVAERGDTVPTLRIEKRTKSQILLSGGADYRVQAEADEALNRRLKKRSFAVRDARGDLYLNCGKLRYQRLRFGAWYAPAVRLDHRFYFCAIPLGSMVGACFFDADGVRLGGEVGDALAASSLVNKRVCYELDGQTGKVEFVSCEKMAALLESHPEWREEYLRRGSPEAKDTFDYLRKLGAEAQAE